jgi:hypothetical protein
LGNNKVMTKQKFLIYGSILLMLMFSCNSEFEEILEVEEQSNQYAGRASSSIPFTVTNMQTALQSVLIYYMQQNKPDVVAQFSNYEVNTTHYYYKFTPSDSTQYKLLMNDTLIDVSIQPFEAEHIEPTRDYSDTEIPAFYAIVKADHQIPANVPVTVLENLHFTNEDALDDSNKTEIEFLLNLTFESRRLQNYLYEDEREDEYYDFNAEDKISIKLPKKWRPSGRVRVEEDRLTTLNYNTRVYVPIRGARVNMLKWGFLQVEHGFTNENGNFSGGTTWTNHITYNLKFKHSFCVVREGNFFDTANHKSDSHHRRAWNHDFNTGGRSHFYALVYNASYDYYFRVVSLYNLHFPWGTTISAKYHGSDSSNSPYWIPFNSTIRVARLNDDGSYRNSDGIYASTVHELTHESHRRMDAGIFAFIHTGDSKERRLMRESWAEGVETIVTNQRYLFLFPGYTASNGDGGFGTNLWNGSKQRVAVAAMTVYTPLVIDLNDNLNQNLLPGTGGLLPTNRVSGYTIRQMQSALKNSRTLTEWRDKLVNNNVNPTEGNIDDVFDYAITVKNN